MCDMIKGSCRTAASYVCVGWGGVCFNLSVSECDFKINSDIEVIEDWNWISPRHSFSNGFAIQAR